MIAKPFILAKDNYRISAKILRDNKIIRDHGAFPDAFAKRWRPTVPKRRGLRVCRLGRQSGVLIRRMADEAPGREPQGDRLTVIGMRRLSKFGVRRCCGLLSFSDRRPWAGAVLPGRPRPSVNSNSSSTSAGGFDRLAAHWRFGGVPVGAVSGVGDRSADLSMA